MYELIQHTADIRMRVRASSPQELFADALKGLMEIVHPIDGGTETTTEEIEIEGVDATVLLVDFLNEVLTRAHVRRHAYTSVDFRELSDTKLIARLETAPVSGFGEDVKAVTYHDAEVVERDGQWSTTLVLDI